MHIEISFLRLQYFWWNLKSILLLYETLFQFLSCDKTWNFKDLTNKNLFYLLSFYPLIVSINTLKLLIKTIYMPKKNLFSTFLLSYFMNIFTAKDRDLLKGIETTNNWRKIRRLETYWQCYREHSSTSFIYLNLNCSLNV